MKYLVLLTLMSCSTIKFDPFVRPDKNAVVEKPSVLKTLWVGQDVEKLDLHPKYASMPVQSRTTGKVLKCALIKMLV